jgi:shikimate kinase/3-dehydroquinate synthase
VNSANRSIVLIGFMGTGKSAVGRLLASQEGWPRFDTDEMIATALKMRIGEIFTRLGAEQFREEEAAVLEKLEVAQPSIIVTGGGAVMRPGNVARLRELGNVVCLTADSPTLLKRLGRRANRPLLQTENPAATMQALLREREPFYQEAADFTVDTSSLSHDQVAQSIRDVLALSD